MPRAGSLPTARHAPRDQADGLRRLFAGRGQHLLPLVANPHLSRGALVLDRIAGALAALGRDVLVVDAAAASPPPHELALLDLSRGVEALAPGVAYLPARGLPRAFVDARGSAAGFVDALQSAAPRAEVLLLHADATDLARLLGRRAVRPLLLADDTAQSLQYAYAACKRLVQRCGWMSFDLLLAAATSPARGAAVAARLAGCADRFLDAALHDWALLDADDDAVAGAQDVLARLLGAQLGIDENPAPAWAAPSEILPWRGAAQPPRPHFR